MIVEKSAFEAHTTATAPATTKTTQLRGPADGTKKGRGRKRGQGAQHGHHPSHPARGSTTHKAGTNGRQTCGTNSGKDDTVVFREEVEAIPADAPRGGLYTYIQTLRCRGVVLHKVFGNVIPSTLFPVSLTMSHKLSWWHPWQMFPNLLAVTCAIPYFSIKHGQVNLLQIHANGPSKRAHQSTPCV